MPDGGFLPAFLAPMSKQRRGELKATVIRMQRRRKKAAKKAEARQKREQKTTV